MLAHGVELEGVQELLRTVALRAFEEALGDVLLHDFAAIEEQHAVGHGAGELHFVGDDDHRFALFRQAQDNVEHFAHHLGVERGGYLVEQQHLGLHGQRTGNGHALLLAAGELARVALLFLGQANALQQGACRFLCFGLRHLLHLDGCKGDVVDDRHVGEQIVALEHHAHLLAKLGEFLFGAVDVCSANLDAAALDGLKCVDAA